MTPWGYLLTETKFNDVLDCLARLACCMQHGRMHNTSKSTQHPIWVNRCHTTSVTVYACDLLDMYIFNVHTIMCFTSQSSNVQSSLIGLHSARIYLYVQVLQGITECCSVDVCQAYHYRQHVHTCTYKHIGVLKGVEQYW